MSDKERKYIAYSLQKQNLSKKRVRLLDPSKFEETTIRSVLGNLQRSAMEEDANFSSTGGGHYQQLHSEHNGHFIRLLRPDLFQAIAQVRPV